METKKNNESQIPPPHILKKIRDVQQGKKPVEKPSRSKKTNMDNYMNKAFK